MNRATKIVQTSIIGIIVNVILAAIKAVIGTMVNSIAITLDAVNNLSDALSSVITIIGTKLSQKAEDKKHPMGYGRVEYLSTTVISVIVLYAGVTSLVEAVKKIFEPQAADYSVVSLVIVAIAVVVKILLGLYFKGVGSKEKSDALIASGQDALFDGVISTATLIAGILYLTTNIGIESYLAGVISIVIIKSGIEMLSDTISKILGERIESEISKEIKRCVATVDGVQGAYDLVLHNYGPDRTVGSIHIEVDDKLTASEIDEITRKIERKVYKEFNVNIVGVGIYAVNTGDDEAAMIRADVNRIVTAFEYVIQMHGFYIKMDDLYMQFDVIVDFAAPSMKEVYHEVISAVQEHYPDYKLQVILDRDISD
ncbi:cation diffusion facilitator family transporter [Lachnospira multipara]|uniref:cation diffusion facilitator family transporter n=1 Tax=Lachnospira multipara TaxID=28051 RepID=UPI00041E5EB6|nr:cation diffusion facilitator family transporter [Lachnospira multipara]